MKRWNRQAVALLLCGVIGICAGCSNTAPAKPVSESTEKISLEIATWDEVKTKIAAHKGKIVVLDLWSTSCQPCIREFPNLVALHKKYPERVVCMSFSSDYAGIKSKPPEYYRERVTDFLTKQKATFENYLCSEPSDEFYPKIDLGSIPAVMVFGTDGKLVNRFDNDEQKYGDEFTYQDHVIPLIEQLLQETAAGTQGEQ